MTNTTHYTAVTFSEPDQVNGSVELKIDKIGVNAAAEILPPKSVYTFSLDGSGLGSGNVPTPDGTGDAAFQWQVTFVSSAGRRISAGRLVSIAYSASTQSLGAIFLNELEDHTVSSITALIDGKQDKDNDATDDNLAVFSSGETVDANITKVALQAAITSASGSLQQAANLSDLQNAVTALANLGAQPSSTILTNLAALTTAADQMIYFSGENTPVVTSLTNFARSVLAANNAAAVRSLLSSAKIYDVKKDYGAALDNSTDDTTAVQNAVAAINGSTEPAILYFSDGIAAVTSTATFARSNVAIMGGGWDTGIRITTADEHVVEFRGTDTNNRIENILVENVGVWGSGYAAGATKPNVDPSWTYASGIEFVYCNNIVVSGCKIMNTQYDGLGFARDIDRVTVEKCHIANHYDDGINIGGTGVGLVSNVFLDRNVIEFCRGFGIHHSGGARDVITANNIINRCAGGTDWTTAENLTISNNHFYNIGEPLAGDANIALYPGGVPFGVTVPTGAIYCGSASSKNVKVEGNFIKNIFFGVSSKRMHGINVDLEGEHITVKGNLIDLTENDTTTYPAATYDCTAIYNNSGSTHDNLVIDGNVCLADPADQYQRGIEYYSSGSGNAVKNNLVSGFKTCIYGGADNLTIIGNVIDKYTTNGMWLVSGDDIAIRDCIIGQHYNYPSSVEDGVFASSGVDRASIVGCVFVNSFVAHSNIVGANISDNQFYSDGQITITAFVDSTGSSTNGGTVENNFMYSEGSNPVSYGIRTRHQSMTISNNKIDGPNIGIYLGDSTSSQDSIIALNKIRNTQNYGIRVGTGGADNTQFLGNNVVMPSGGLYAYWFRDSQRLSIVGNMGQNNSGSYATMHMQNVDYSAVTGNQLSNAGSNYGLGIPSGSDNNTVIANVVSSAGATKILNSGSGNDVDHNITL